MQDRQVAPVTTLEGEASVERRPEPVHEPDAAEEAVLADLLVEEVSIDGMCGVY